MLSIFRSVALLLLSGGLSFLLPFSTAYAESHTHTYEYYVQHTPPLPLSQVEQDWLKEHTPLIVAFDGYFPPFSFFDEQNRLAGYSYDYWRLLAKKLQTPYQLYPNHVWKDLYQAGLNQQVNVIVGMVKRPYRIEHFAFTDPFIFKRNAFFIRHDEQNIHTLEDLAGKRIAVVESFQYIPYLKKTYPNGTLASFPTSEKAAIAVIEGQADATINNIATINFMREYRAIEGLKFLDYTGQPSANESFATPKAQALLAALIQRAMDAITPTERAALYAKWQPIIIAPIDERKLLKQAALFSLVILALLFIASRFYIKSKQLEAAQKELEASHQALKALSESLESQVKQRTQELEKSKEAYRSLVENLQHDYFFYRRLCDPDGELLYISPSIQNILGTPPHRFMEEKSPELLNQLLNSRPSDLLLTRDPLHLEITLTDSKGEDHIFEITETPVFNNQGECIAYDGIAHEVTQLKRIQEQLTYLSYYDALTDLPNRRLFMEKGEQILALAQRHQQSLCFLFIDINKFKMINDTYGHEVGDEVLVQVAKIIRQHLRHSDIAARLGGDEFTLLLPDCNHETVLTVIQKIQAPFETPLTVNDKKISVSLSIGYALYPEDGEDLETLMQHADMAMYHAKKHHLGALSYAEWVKIRSTA